MIVCCHGDGRNENNFWCTVGVPWYACTNFLSPLQSQSSTSVRIEDEESPSVSNSNILAPFVGLYPPPELSVASAKKLEMNVLPL